MKKLAEHYHAPYLLEWEEPTADADIVTYIKKNTHPIERYRYFRDLSVAHHLCAEKMTGAHPLVFIDTFWFNNAPWIEVYNATPAERRVMQSIFDADAAALPRPACAIYLEADIETSRRFADMGGRSFDKEFETQMIQLKNAYRLFMAHAPLDFPCIEIDRTGLDFDTPEHLKIVTDKIDSVLKP